MNNETELRWTGERLVTIINNEDTIHHLHRYAISLEYIKDKVVLDIASGEGYGTNLIAKTAKFVYGVDISKEAVDFAKTKYSKTENAEFILGSVEKIPLTDHSIDVVVSFETLEHTDKHEEMMTEVKRVLKPEGILIISSPDKANYSDRFDRINEFHIKELYMKDFKLLMARYFKNCLYFYQTFVTGSLIIRDDFISQGLEEFSGDFKHIDLSEELKFPMYNIAIVSDSSIENRKSSYFNGTDTIREMHYDQVMRFTPYRLGNAILKPLRAIFKRK